MSKRLIVNADDYGRSPEISEGIRLAHKYGVVTSTSCMMNIPSTTEDVRLALKETPDLGLGVHLVLTMGKPILPHGEIKSATDAQGNFFKYKPFVENLPNLKVEEVKAEWRAQIEVFVQAAGKEPDHLDSHHHSSYFSPALFRAMLELAKGYNCPIRFPFTGRDYDEIEPTRPHVPALLEEFSPRRPDLFISDFYDEQATMGVLMGIVESLGEGTTEVMCHPGFVPDSFVSESVYNKQRQRELGIFLDPAVRNTIAAKDIELISFADL